MAASQTSDLGFAPAPHWGTSSRPVPVVHLKYAVLGKKRYKWNQRIPVLILAALPSSNHAGRAIPRNREKPKMQIFRDEFMSTNCRFDTPTAAMIPGTVSK